jgi:hypothetical protein
VIRKPNDKLLILEDSNNDGKADKQTVFADGLHLPVGFELAPEGVYVSQEENLVLLKDNNGDDKADEKIIVLSGFDDHDTHHTISAFCTDPSGAIVMGEGLFLHSAVETPYGTVRAPGEAFSALIQSAFTWSAMQIFQFPIPGALPLTSGGRIFTWKHPVRNYGG